jgi:hypothetical protein
MTFQMINGEEAERVSRRLECLLNAQRERFEEYVQLLDSQAKAIEKGSAESIAAHISLERKLRNDIESLQKVIIPLRAHLPPEMLEKSAGIACAHEAIEDLKNDINRFIKRNKELLEYRMKEVEDEMIGLRSISLRRSRSFNAPSSMLVDMQG